MDINQIRYFLEVCRSGSITKAAEIINISQQGLSLSIKRLEAELKGGLFYRKPSGIVLTELGKLVMAEAEQIEEHVERIYSIARSRGEGQKIIRVAITESIIVRLPAKLQQILLTGSEDFGIELVELFSYEVADAVNSGRADFGILYGECDENKFDSTLLDIISQVIIVNKKHPLSGQSTVTLSELAGLPFIAPSEESFPRCFLNKLFKEKGLPLNVAYVCNRPRQVIDIVSNNPILISRVVSDEITDLDLDKISVLELTDNPFFLPIRLISKKGSSSSVYGKLFKLQAIDAYKSNL